MTGGHHRNENHWADIREKGSLLGMRILLTANRYGGRRLFQLFLLPVVLFYVAFHPVARRASLDYRQTMHRFNPAFPAPAFWHGFRHMWNFANTLLDKLAVWQGTIGRDDVLVTNGEMIDELLAAGQGAVLLISHLGNFEVCQALSENRKSLRLTVLQHTVNAEKFNRFLEHHSRETRVEFMQVTDLDVAQAITLSERIGAGQFIAISADRVPIANPERAAVHDFIGRPAAFPTGPFILAMALQAPVLSVQCIKLGGRYHIDFELLSPGGSVARKSRQQRLSALMASYVDNLQRHCLLAPWQWYNFYPFWQVDTPREKQRQVQDDNNSESTQR